MNSHECVLSGVIPSELHLVGVLNAMECITGRIDADADVRGRLATGDLVIMERTQQYEGAYEVVPGDEEQVLRTSMTKLTHDVIVKPIPRNYGKITWDGSKLTVS